MKVGRIDESAGGRESEPGEPLGPWLHLVEPWQPTRARTIADWTRFSVGIVVGAALMVGIVLFVAAFIP